MRDNDLVVFDFDGTIVNVWERYYRVFIKAAKTKTEISIDEYREIKTKYLRDDIVAEKVGIILPPDYYDDKRALLERRDYLFLDTLVLESKKLIDFVSNTECIILTKRNKSQCFFAELEYLELNAIKSNCIVLDPSLGISKYEFCKRNYSDKRITVLGDSNDEYEFSADRSNRVFLVNTGLRSNTSFVLKDNINLIYSINEFIDEC